MARPPPSPFPSVSESISYFTDPFPPSFAHFTAMEDPTFPLCATTACSSFHLVIHLGLFLFLRLAFLACRVLAEKGKRWREGRRKGMRGTLCMQREEICASAWRWATDIRATQSKWLEKNLREMEHMVTNILKVVESDTNSFSEREELYFKGRSELIGLVEDAYRSYRTLVARLDCVSGELNKANYIIAINCPDQVQHPMPEEEEDNIFPKAFIPTHPSKINRTVDGFIEKRKIELPVRKVDDAKARSQVDDMKVQEEINDLHEGILALQVEKEAVKRSYESGIAKYWDIERQIIDMYDEMCWWLDEHSTAGVISDVKDDMLVTEKTLTSCEHAIGRLQEQRQIVLDQVKLESERIKIIKEKLKALMRDCCESGMDNEEIVAETTETIFISEIVEKEDSLDKTKLELQTIRDKIKKCFEMNPEVYTVEITGNIDKLVDKVASLKLIVSSQVVQINQLTSDINELEKSAKNLEEEKMILIKDSAVPNVRLTLDELRKVEAIEKIIRDEELSFHENLIEIIHIINGISEMLPSCKLAENACVADVLCKDVEITEIHDIKEDLVEEIHMNQPLAEFLEDYFQNKADALLKNASEVGNKNDVETKNKNYILEMIALIGELVNVITARDEEIQWLRALEAGSNGSAIAPSVEDSCHSEILPSKPATTTKDSEISEFPLQSDSSDHGINVECVNEKKCISSTEEKFRKDVNHLVDKNLEFWLRFSTTHHYVQQIKAKYEELLADINKPNDKKTEEGNSQAGKTESESFVKRLGQFKTELLVWSEQSLLLRGELERRLSSLRSMQEEISNIVNIGSSSGEALFAPDEAMRLQNEAMGMKHESGKSLSHLLGLDQIRGVQTEIEKQLTMLCDNFQVYVSGETNDPSKEGVPLSTFFELEPKKPSTFSRILPLLRKYKNKVSSR
ncbi:protein NETWORKED 2B-like isoform X1 [Zingiber officinale]|uniref:protein NETWORKED 2B-like isoform X1 n=1 Tax=Zingiber officinale TaxID=94328 RepID=UPI001C4AB321|nr:protein NETWORKED 2B-like isoform X1 [Zingiber officinale]